MGILKLGRSPLTLARRLRRSVKRTIRNNLRILDTALASEDSFEIPGDPETAENTEGTTRHTPPPPPRPKKRAFGPPHHLHTRARGQTFSLFPRESTSIPVTLSPSDALSLGCTQVASRAIPGDRSNMIFYDIPVSTPTWSAQDYENRFKYVKGELMRAVVDHDELRPSGRHINYSQHMIGTSAQTAIPSILVECRTCDLKALRDLFNSQRTDRLYCRKESSWHKLFNTDLMPPKPPFQLVYLSTDRQPTRRYAAQASADTANLPAQTLCGTLVEHQGRRATIGLALIVDGISRLITVDHLFHHDLGDETSLYTTDDMTVSATGYAEKSLSSEKGNTSNPQLWIELDLEDAENNQQLTPTALGNASRSDISTLTDNVPQKPAKAVEGNFAPPTMPLHTSAPYLDWAFVDLETRSDEFQLKNFVFPPQSSDPVLLEKMADAPRFHGVPVYMFSGIEGVRNGHLLGGLAYLGPRPGHEPCPVWTMLLESPKGLMPGECGSIVVDQQTFEVYGHVVGSNIMKHIHVVPLKETIKQIRASFGATAVCFPQLGSRPNTSDPLDVFHGSKKTCDATAIDPPRLPDNSRSLLPGHSAIESSENRPFMHLLQDFDDRTKVGTSDDEINRFMLAEEQSARWERYAKRIEHFCAGARFVLDSSVPQPADCFNVPQNPYIAWVSDIDLKYQNPSRPGLISSDLDLYHVLQDKNFWNNPQGGVGGNLPRRIYINCPTGPSTLALIRTVPASQAKTLRCLLAQYVTARPRAFFRIRHEPSWNPSVRLSFQFPFFACFSSQYEDPRPLDKDGQYFRRSYDLSFLCPGCPEGDSERIDRHKLHETVISVSMVVQNEEHCTVFCFEDGVPDLRVEGGFDEIEDPITWDESILCESSPQVYFLRSLNNHLSKIFEHQLLLLELFECKVDSCTQTVTCAKAEKGLSGTNSTWGDMMKTGNLVADSIHDIETKIQQFLELDARICPDGTPQGRYMRAIQHDQLAMRLFREIIEIRKDLQDIETDFRRLLDKMKDLVREQEIRRPKRQPFVFSRWSLKWIWIWMSLSVINLIIGVVLLGWMIAGRV